MCCGTGSRCIASLALDMSLEQALFVLSSNSFSKHTKRQLTRSIAQDCLRSLGAVQPTQPDYQKLGDRTA